MKKVYELFLFTAVIVCCALFVIACAGPGGNDTGVLPDNVYFVRATAPNGGDGRSWDTAFNLSLIHI